MRDKSRPEEWHRELPLCSAAGSPAPQSLVEAMVRAGRIRHARRGEILVEAGDRSTGLLLVMAGRLRVEIFGWDGDTLLLRDAEPGSMLGELAAIDGQPRSAAITALEPTRLLQVPADAFRQAIIGDPEAAHWFWSHLAAMVRQLSDRLFEQSTLDVRARLHCHLLRLAQGQAKSAGVTCIAPAPTHEAMAQAIGTHREAVSREMAALRRAGLIDKRGRQLILADIAALSRLVERAIGARATSFSGL